MQRTELLSLLRRGSRCQVPGLSVDRVYSKHLFQTDRITDAQREAIKTYSLCGLLGRRRRKTGAPGAEMTKSPDGRQERKVATEPRERLLPCAAPI